ncbi:MAG: Tm-1-like ATP-binding domain-containing protein, partial [Sciscionella sp.]
LGIPQTVSVGATDVVNFGPPEAVPTRFRGRTLVQHNPQVTLMRTDKRECVEIARTVAAKLNGATGPVSLFLPLQGASALSAPGGAFCDPDADQVLRDELAAALGKHIDIVTLDMNINDPRFGRLMAERLVWYLDSASKVGG